MKAYKVYENVWGFDRNIKYWLTLDKAEEDLSQRIEQCKKDENVASDDDLDSPNFQPMKTTDKSIIKSICVVYWQSCPTDCGTEWDTESKALTIEEIEIN